MKRWFLKGVLAGSVGTAAVLAAATAVAATVGDPFRLGQANAINATSALVGSTANNQLDVANVGTGSNAKGLGVLGRSPSAAAGAFANTNGGPALGLSVNAGKAPFTVNSSTKVTGLNADLVDGVHASGFVQGGGTVFHNRLVLAKASGRTPLVTVPGFGVLYGKCLDVQGTTVAALQFESTSSGTLDSVWFDRGGTYEKTFTTDSAVLTGLSPYPWLVVFQAGDTNGRVLTLEASQRADQPVAGKCVLMATATVQP